LYVFFIAFNYLYSQKGQSTNENRLSKSNRVKNNANDENNNNNDSFDENSSNSTRNTRNIKTISNSSSKNLSDSSKHNVASRSHHHHHHHQQQQRTHRSAHHNSNTNTRKQQQQHQHHHHYTNSKTNKMSEEIDANDVEVEGAESNLMSKCKNLTNIYKSESAKAFRDVKGKIESKLKSLANNSKLSSSLVKMSAHESSSRKNAKHVDAEKPKMTRQQLRDLKIVHPTPRRDVKKSASNRQRYSSDEVDEQEEEEETYKEITTRKKSNQSSKQDFESPTRPAPPKRPPPPRPSSPTTSFSNYSFTEAAHRHQSTSHGKSKANTKTPRKTQNPERDHSISPQSLNTNKKRGENGNCHLPPRPPLPTSHSTSTSKTKSSSNKNNEDFLSDCQIYEFEELKLRNGKKNATNNKKNLGLIREENSKESHRNHKMSNHSSSTPSLTLSSQSPSPELPIEKVSRRNHSHQRVNNERKKS